MPRDVDVLVPGRPGVDLVFTRLGAWPSPGREIYADGLVVAAGSHFNTAAALARLGLRVALVATVGDDFAGEVVRRELRAEGLADAFVRVVDGVATPVSVALNGDGDRGFVTFAPGHEHAEDAYVGDALALLESGGVRHVHADLSAAPRLLGAAREAGSTVSVDAHDAGPGLASDAVRDLVADVDLLFANEAEAAAIAGTGAEDAAETLGARSPHVVVKRGARGATAVVGGTRFDAPVTPAELVDATGAGDCFAAGYLWGWLHGAAPSACLAYGNVCGARAVAVAGGYHGAPTEEELVAAVRSGPA